MCYSVKNFTRACVFACALFAIFSCKDNDDYLTKEEGSSPKEVNYFDFSTTQDVDLIVDYSAFKIYGPVWFSVYTVNPYVNEMTATEYINENIKPIYSGYTDAKGKFDATVTLPAYAKVLHVVTGNFFVYDRRIVTEIVNGRAMAKAVNQQASAARRVTRVVGTGTSTKDLSKMTHLYKTGGGEQVCKQWSTALGTWNSNSGRPDYLLDKNDPELISKGLVFTEDEVNGMYGTACDALNSCSNKEQYRQASDLTLIKASEVSITALGSSTCWNSSLGYYYYTGDAPTNKMDLNIIMIFPNTQDGEWPRGNYPNNDYKGNIGTLRGDVVQLMYYPPKADGTLDYENGTTMFPQGTKIGFMLKTNAWGQRGSNYAVNSCTGKKNIWASSTEGLSYAPDGGTFPNPNGEARSAKFAYTAPNGRKYVVVSFEDACDDLDYDDLMFGLNPANVFDFGDVAQIESNKSTIESVYAFEDFWPEAGDYDMNDIMIDCKHEEEFYTHADGNKLNKERFYLTTYQNYVARKSGLAVVFNASDIATLYVTKILPGQTETVETNKMYDKKYYYLSEFNWDKNASKYWYLTDDIKSNLGTTYVFEVTYTKPLDKGQATIEPFIYRSESDGKQWEVHLPKKAPTNKMNTSYFGTYADRSVAGKGPYYIGDSEYPFAFHLQGVSIDVFKETTLKRENESKPIDTFFPEFIQWSKSNGKKSTDWYLHPNPNAGTAASE